MFAPGPPAFYLGFPPPFFRRPGVQTLPACLTIFSHFPGDELVNFQGGGADGTAGLVAAFCIGGYNRTVFFRQRAAAAARPTNAPDTTDGETTPP